MKLANSLIWLKYKCFLILFLILLFVYIIFRFLILGTDPIIPFISSISDSYLSLSEKFANQLFIWTNHDVYISKHHIILNKIQIFGFYPALKFINIGALSLLLVWLTRTNIGRKLLFTFLFVLANYLFVSIYIAAEAHIVSIETEDESFPALVNCLANIFMITISLIWYKINKDSILTSLSNLKINQIVIEKKISCLFILGYVYFIAIQLLLEHYADLYFWINFLLNSSQKVLILFGVRANVEPYYLVGSNGALYVTSACLGINSMFYFAAIIYLSKKRNLSCLIYILSGIVFMNFINILRLAFLFVQVQKTGGGENFQHIHAVSVHVVHAIYFVLLLIWFEKFADFLSFKKIKIDVD